MQLATNQKRSEPVSTYTNPTDLIPPCEIECNPEDGYSSTEKAERGSIVVPEGTSSVNGVSAAIGSGSHKDRTV